MSLTRRLAWNTVVQIFGKIVSTGLGLVAVAMLTRYLGAEKFGWYTTVIAFLQFVGILIDFGLIPVTAQMLGETAGRSSAAQESDTDKTQIARDKLALEKTTQDKTALLQNLLGFRLTTAIIFLGLSPLVAWFFPYPHEVKLAISFTTVSFLAIAINQIFTGYCQNELKMRIAAAGEIIGRLALVAGLYFLIKNGASFLPLMAVISVSSAVYTLYMWWMTGRLTAAGLAFNLAVWKEIIKKSWPIAVSIIFNIIYLKGDTIILTFYRAQTEVGLYGAAYRVLDILTQTAMLLMGLMLPILAGAYARKDTAEFGRRYQQSFDAMMMLAVPAAAGTALIATPIMRLVAGAEFTAAGPVLAILALAVFGLYLGAVFGHTAVAINKQKATMWVYISDAIITLLGYLYFIPRYGLFGAAWMTVFSELYAGLLLWYVIHKQKVVSLSLIGLAKIMAASAIMAGGIYLFPALPALVTIMLATLVYLASLYVFRGIPRATLKEIFSST